MKISRTHIVNHPQSVMRAGYFLLFACLLLISSVPDGMPGLSPSSVFAREPIPPKKVRTQLSPEQQQQVIEKNVRIRKLQEGIIDHKIKILDSKHQERTLLDELETIENELQTQKKLLADLKMKSEKQEMLIADKQKYLGEVLTEKKAHQVHVKNRLAAYYRMGSVGVMNVLFSADSLPELLDFNEYFSIMVKHDHAIIQQYLGEIRTANRAREEHAREKLNLLILSDELNSKEKQLNRIHEEKNLLLRQVNTEQHLYNQAVAEIEEAVADLAATLQKIESADRQPVSASSPEVIETEKKKIPKAEVVPEGFPGRKGLLEPPVTGRVTTIFGQKIKGKFDSSTVSNGIDIRTGNDMKITAIYDGKVIHSGYLRGYGNLMILDHGQQYFSLISRAAEFYQNEGTKVSQGEVIGVTGEPDPLYGEGIHFEIRKGSNAEDPLLWLRKNSLPVAAAGVPDK